MAQHVIVKDTTTSNGGQGVTLTELIAGEDQTNNVLVVEQGQYEYETVAASQTDQVLGATGAAGDFIHSIVVDSATGTVVLKDDTTAILTIPASGTGVWELNLTSKNGAFKVTTAASTTCLCVGRFT